MKFTTEVKVEPLASQISYKSRVLLLGSCFANNIGNKLQYYEFEATVNVFGVIFNPISLTNLIERALESRYFTPDDLVFHNEQWHCFETHSVMSHSNQTICLDQLNNKLMVLQKELLHASHFVLTLGSAWVYKDKSTQKVVANCHKIPQNQFEKCILSVEEIQECMIRMSKKLHQKNPTIQIIWTVSPVRHQKDGLIQNQRSKSHLCVAIHYLLELNEFLNHHYFPSYELLIDELRDYRFYATDMLHPSEVAIEFIWKKFKECIINADLYLLMNEINACKQSRNHLPLNPDSEQHRLFLENLIQKEKNIHDKLTFLKLKSS